MLKYALREKQTFCQKSSVTVYGFNKLYFIIKPC